MKSVLLTGGTGFFGKNILRTLQPDVKLTILSRTPDKFISDAPEAVKNFRELVAGDKVSFIKGDIRNFTLSGDNKFDYVIHGATEASAKLEKENPHEMYSVIVDGTKHLLNELNKNNRRARLLFISSGAVYGKQPPGLTHIPEDFPCNPITSYGKGKFEAEKICIDSGISVSIARCFAFVGPYLPLDTHFAIGNFILNGLKDEPIIIKGDGTPYRSYMYTDDLVEWLWIILLKGKSGEAYNVGSEEAVSIADLAHLVSSCFDNKPEVKTLGIPTQYPTLNTQHLIHHESRISNSNSKLKTQNLELPSHYIPSTQKTQKQLDLKIQIGLKEAIQKTIDWYKI